MIRDFEPKDLEATKRIHAAQGFAYEFPKLTVRDPDGGRRENPLYFIKLVDEREGQIVQAAFAHLTAEIYFLLDPKWSTPQERHLAFLEMMDVGRQKAWHPGGLEDLHAFLPPQVERSFGKRLLAHGWNKAPWSPYFTEVNHHGTRTSAGS